MNRLNRSADLRSALSQDSGLLTQGKSACSNASSARRLEVGDTADRRSALLGSALRLRVSARAESIVRSGHPWLFADSIRGQTRTGQLGDLVVIYDRKDRFLALGLFDPESAIRVRVLHTGKPQPVNRAFWDQKLKPPLKLRSGLFDERTTGFRWIHGESDGWPGLVLDRYGATLVLKLYTAAWLPWLETIVGLFAETLRPQTIVLRLSRNIQEVTRRVFGKRDGRILQGADSEATAPFLETGLHFEADIVRGQKTGFFLDQRENRRRLETLARGRSVLNAFSFSGAFSLYAARGGARSITELDISAHALAAAERNFSLNDSDPPIRGCACRRVQADAFAWLAENPEKRFDLVVLDPPSMARRESERAGAIAAYLNLARMGIAHLARGGMLLACSCSAHVSEAEFYQAVLTSAANSRRPFREIARAGQPADHPAAFEQTKYLKAVYLRFDSGFDLLS